MPVETLFINGPSGGGKTMVAQLVAGEVLERQPHYLRVRASDDGHTNAVIPVEAGEGAAGERPELWASRHLVLYSPDRVFETVPEALRKVRRIQRRAFAVIEANADPPLRHAFPYDYRIFVMGSPADVHEVFRTPKAAAMALQEVMQDTAAFASEIFGLFDADALDDSLGVEHRPPEAQRESRAQPVERLEITEAQIRHFLRSPLGGEIASRIQLQPDYHGMVESDVVLINTGVGEEGEALRECVARIERLLARVRHETRRHSLLYWGDIATKEDPIYLKLLRRLKTLLAM